jgi:hypothetical protein
LLSELAPVVSERTSNNGREDEVRNSALNGHVDYVDLAERVVQGVTVELTGVPAEPPPKPDHGADRDRPAGQRRARHGRPHR